MAPLAPPRNLTVEGATERFDPIACLDGRVRRRATPLSELRPGRYLEVQGPREVLLIPLGEEALRIGRGVGAELRLDEPSVSRRHAILDPGPDEPRILDDRSSNGTFLNGVRVQQAPLRNGDVITIGRIVLRYLEVGPAERGLTR